MNHDFKSREVAYTRILRDCKVSTGYIGKIANAATLIQASAGRYRAVSEIVHVPWPLIGAIHRKESSGKFTCNLHNGQPLDIVTTIVPKGRGPFKSWEESAIDALKGKRRLIDSIDTIDGAWSLEQCLWFAEAYNGFGYLSHGINSPYLWAGTTAYTKGGYPRDGHYDPEHVVKNAGVAGILLWGFSSRDLKTENMLHDGVRFIESDANEV